MAIIFKRITKMEWAKKNSFHMGSPIYLALTSGDNIPMSDSGALPVVIDVDTARMAILLAEAGAIKAEDIPDWLRPQYEDEKGSLSDCNYYREAIDEMRDEADTMRSLLRDYRSAARKNERQIYYHVS